MSSKTLEISVLKLMILILVDYFENTKTGIRLPKTCFQFQDYYISRMAWLKSFTCHNKY